MYWLWPDPNGISLSGSAWYTFSRVLEVTEATFSLPSYVYIEHEQGLDKPTMKTFPNTLKRYNLHLFLCSNTGYYSNSIALLHYFAIIRCTSLSINLTEKWNLTLCTTQPPEIHTSPPPSPPKGWKQNGSAAAQRQWSNYRWLSALQGHNGRWWYLG